MYFTCVIKLACKFELIKMYFISSNKYLIIYMNHTLGILLTKRQRNMYICLHLINFFVVFSTLQCCKKIR